MKKILFLDRDGTLALEPGDEQLDSLDKLEFYPGVFQSLSRIARELDYELVMVSNQDGLGTESFPEDNFWPAHNKIIEAFKNEGVVFSEILIDRTLPADQADTRKPGTGMLGQYIEGDYDLSGSFVIGDRLTDVELAKNLGAKGILLGPGDGEGPVVPDDLRDHLALRTQNWEEIYRFLKLEDRTISMERNTNETRIRVALNLDGTGDANVDTGIDFFDHMLDQLARHSGADLDLKVSGDLNVDEHHTIEDTAIALGEAFSQALGNKLGIERYGFCLPMDDALAQVAIDFGGRNWIEWDVKFKREKIGEMPTEMFYHFFKSFTDGAKCNLNIKAEGNNEHHKIEAIFKGLARAIRSAIRRDPDNNMLPTTKGML